MAIIHFLTLILISKTILIITIQYVNLVLVLQLIEYFLINSTTTILVQGLKLIITTILITKFIILAIIIKYVRYFKLYLFRFLVLVFILAEVITIKFQYFIVQFGFTIVIIIQVSYFKSLGYLTGLAIQNQIENKIF